MARVAGVIGRLAVDEEGFVCRAEVEPRIRVAAGV
jgi:hypothetical protein